MFDHHYGKEIFHNVQSEPPQAQICAILFHPVIGDEGDDLKFTGLEIYSQVANSHLLFLLPISRVKHENKGYMGLFLFVFLFCSRAENRERIIYTKSSYF